MTRREFYEALDRRIPKSYSEEWDNDGALLLIDPEKKVEKILCTLDVSDEVIRYAEEKGFDLILSHHPLIFKGVKALDGETPTSRRVLALVSADIAAFSFHTRLDAMEGGINDALSSMLGLSEVAPIDEGEGALGRIGTLRAPMPLEDFCALVKKITDAPFVTVLKKTDAVSRVAVVGGEGKDLIGEATNAGADTYLSGSLGYHAMLDGEINLIECGHYFSEKHAATLLSNEAKAISPDVKVEIYTPNSLAIY